MNRLLSKLGVPTVMLVLPVLYLLAFGVLTVASYVRDPPRLPLRPGRVAPGGRDERVGGGDQHRSRRPPRPDAGVPVRRPDPGGHGAGRASSTLVGERAVSPRVLYGFGLAAAGGAVYSMARVRRAYAAELVVALREGRPHVFGGDAGRGRALRARPRRPRRRRGRGRRDGRPRRRRAPGRRGAPRRASRHPTRTAALIRGRARRRPRGPGDRAALPRPLGGVRGLRCDPRTADRPRAEVRLAALEALGALRADRSRARALLADPDGLVRARAAGHPPRGRRRGRSRGRGAGEDDPEAEAALTRLTRSPHAEARVAAFRALAARGPRRMDLARDGARGPHSVGASRGGAHDDRAWIRSAGSKCSSPRSIGGGDVLEAADEAMAARRRVRRRPVRRLAEPRRTAPSRAAGSATRSRRTGDERLDAAPRLPPRGIPSGTPSSRSGPRRSCAIAARSPPPSRACRATDPAQRANALEVIETIGDHDLVRPLLALWEPARSPTPRSRLAGTASLRRSGRLDPTLRRVGDRTRPRRRHDTDDRPEDRTRRNR